MKYIRTKDTKFRIGEILKVLDEDEDYFVCEGTFEKRMGCKVYVKKEIVVKVADTIEELFDEFVHITNIGNHMLGHFWSPDSSDTVYGAIWTDKGLIYVAKMKGILPNGEIDWELL